MDLELLPDISKGPHKAMHLLQVVVCTGSQPVHGITAVEAVVQHVTAAGHPELMACGFQVKVLVSSSKKEVSVAHAQQEITVQHHWNRNLSNNQVLRSLSTSLDRDLPCICLQPVPDTTTSCCHGPLLA